MQSLKYQSPLANPLHESRFFGFSERIVTVSPIVFPIVSFCQRRYSLTFSIPSGATVRLTTNPSPAATQGYQLGSSQPNQTFDWFTHGAILTSEWFGVSGAGNVVITVFENIAFHDIEQAEEWKLEQDKIHKRSQRRSPVIGYSPAIQQSKACWIDDLCPAIIPVHNRTKWQGSRIGQGVDLLSPFRADNPD